MQNRSSVFVSYAHRDPAWHKRLTRSMHLLERIFRVECWSDRKLDASDDWERQIREAMARARVAVLLVSQAFLDSDFIARVELPALMADWESGAMGLVAVAVEPVTLPEDHPLRKVQFLRDPKTPLAALDADAWHEALAEVAARVADLMGIQRHGRPENLPYRTLGRLFKGREPFLLRLRRALPPHTGEDAAPDPTLPRRSVAIYGLGGVGKTRVAIEFAHRYADDYTALLFVRADSPEGLNASLAALCGPLVLDLAEKEVREREVQVMAALQWLRQHPGWFLILDNVDSEEAAEAVEELLGRLSGAGQVLITSRISRWSSAVESLALDVLTVEDAADFLRERTEPGRRKQADDMDQARTLAVTLGQLALALEQAGAMIKTNRYSFARYLQEWRSRHEQVLTWFDERLMQYPMSVAVTWQTSFDQLKAPARRLLHLLAWFATDPIPETLLDVPIAETGASETDADAITSPYDALADLEAYSLVTRDDETPMFTVHRLVQDVTRRSLQSDPDHSALTTALRWVNTAFVGHPQDVRSWPTLEPLAPHAQACAQFADGVGLTTPTSRLFNKLGVLYNAQARHAAAEPLMRRALAIDETSYGTEHPDVAIDLNNLAQLLKVTNRLSEAEPLMRRALAIDETSYGTEHPKVAIRLNNLAQLLQATNRLSEAEPLMRRALAIDEASYGTEHPRVAIDLNNLAQLLKVTNRLSEAEPLMRRALAIDEASYGTEHPRVAIDLNNLAQLLKVTNRLSEAEPLMRRALAIDETSYGTEHPKVAIRLNNLAQLLQATNRLSEAEPLMRRALAIDETSYGTEHPDVAIDLNNLAQLLQDTNRLSEAEPLMRRALAIDETSYGTEHPDVAIDLNNLAQLLQATNRLSEAEPLMRRALAIDETSYGTEHPRVAIDLNNLAQLLQDTNRLSEAEPLMRRALAIDETSYGTEHPDVAIDLNNLAQLLQATNRLSEAEPLMRRALAIDEASYGTEHPRVAIDLNNLAQLLKVTNRLSEAEPLMRRALAIDETSYGTEHPKVAIRLNNLAQLLQATNRLSEAEPLMRRALAIDETSYGTEHPDVAIDLNNLAQLLQDTNRLSEAEPLMRRAVEIFQSSYGPEHPSTLTVTANLADLLQQAGN